VKRPADWGKTNLAKERLKKERKLDGEESYSGRFIIHRDGPIDGGVYISVTSKEAIVVDSQKYPKLKELYNRAKLKATEKGIVQKDLILEAVFNTVSEAIPKQDERSVAKIVREFGVGKDGKIALDKFLERGTGVCRHDALTCAALLEMFNKEGMLSGKPSLDRNATEMGAHAWCRYTNSAGQVYILDVAKNFLGTLKSARGSKKWVYERRADF